MAQISNQQSPISNRTVPPFSMPMFREWVPKRIQPWIYIAQVICIQFSCGVYLGAMEAVRGTTALQLEELLMLLYAGLAGMAVWCPMPQRMPLKGIDISTGLLISLLMLMISYILVYGDRLMWFFSPTLRWLLALSLLLLAFIMYRLKTVEQPYISLEIFKYKNVLAILFVTAVAELLLGAEHTLEEIYWTEVRGLEEHTKGALCLWSLPGVYAGVLITLYWLGHARWKVWKLFAIGFGCILVYSMWMYFYLDVNVPIEQYRLGLAFRGCAYAILAVSLMWSLHESVHDLQHFFMALFIFNVIHMYLAGASGYGLYTTLFKHFMADNMARYGDYLTLTSTSLPFREGLGLGLSSLSLSVMSVTLKQIFGQIIWVSGFMMFAFLLLDIPRVRTGVEKVPYWPVYGIKMLARLR